MALTADQEAKITASMEAMDKVGQTMDPERKKKYDEQIRAYKENLIKLAMPGVVALIDSKLVVNQGSEPETENWETTGIKIEGPAEFFAFLRVLWERACESIKAKNLNLIRVNGEEAKQERVYVVIDYKGGRAIAPMELKKGNTLSYSEIKTGVEEQIKKEEEADNSK
jgi:hypothetical protein